MKEIEKIINYKFKDKSLLELAQTHSSYAHKYNLNNNERLEFLGDSILGYVVAEFLMINLNSNEGELTKTRAKLVSCENLSEVITKNKLNNFIKTFPNNLNSEAIKGDFFEALIGAIYLDGGLEESKNFIFNFLKLNTKNINNLLNKTKDFKSELQELVQSKKGNLEYKLIGTQGEANNLTFEFELLINNKSICFAKEKTKQKAQNLCAQKALKKIDKIFD